MANKIYTSIEGVNKGLSSAILTGKSDIFSYDGNGKRTSQEKIGTKFTIVLPGNRLTTITVKVEGDDPLPKITDETIAEACASMKFIMVKFDDCVVSLYTMNGQIGMTGTASGAVLVNTLK